MKQRDEFFSLVEKTMALAVLGVIAVWVCGLGLAAALIYVLYLAVQRL
jgi:hypothetical protein